MSSPMRQRGHWWDIFRTFFMHLLQGLQTAWAHLKTRAGAHRARKSLKIEQHIKLTLDLMILILTALCFQ